MFRAMTRFRAVSNSKHHPQEQTRHDTFSRRVKLQTPSSRTKLAHFLARVCRSTSVVAGKGNPLLCVGWVGITDEDVQCANR